MSALVAAVVAFMVMEPVTYAAHRWVMHGVGWAWHRSHHRRRRPASRFVEQFERNDWFPVVFAGITIVAMAVGSADRGMHLLVPVGVGVTSYGAAYAFVHDLYIHGRFASLPVWRPLERLKEAHALHHRFGGEPYGMLCPVVPRQLRERAARAYSPTVVAGGTTASRSPVATS